MEIFDLTGIPLHYLGFVSPPNTLTIVGESVVLCIIVMAIEFIWMIILFHKNRKDKQYLREHR